MANNPILYQSLFGDLRPLPKPLQLRKERRIPSLVWIGQEKGRRCRDCGYEGPLEDFRTNKSQPDGVQSICKRCGTHHTKKWQSENREQYHEYKAAYMSDRRIRNRIYWETHEPSGTKRCPRCSTEKDVSDFYRDANKDDGLRVYCNNCEKNRGRGHRKHWRTLIKRQGWVCNPLSSKPGCGRPLTEVNRGEVDHIIPRSKGGSDDIGNLQVLCTACNRRWSNRIPNKDKL